MGIKVANLRDIPRMLASLEVVNPVPTPRGPKELDDDDAVECVIVIGGVRIEHEMTAAEYRQIVNAAWEQDPKIAESF